MHLKTDEAGNRKPTRANADVKIDLVIAVLLAIDRWARQASPAAEESVYTTRRDASGELRGVLSLDEY